MRGAADRPPLSQAADDRRRPRRCAVFCRAPVRAWRVRDPRARRDRRHRQLVLPPGGSRRAPEPRRPERARCRQRRSSRRQTGSPPPSARDRRLDREPSGPHLVYWINAATFLFSARCSCASPHGSCRATGDHPRALARSRGRLRCVSAFARAPYRTDRVCVPDVGLGLVNVAEIFLATRSLDAGAFGYGLRGRLRESGSSSAASAPERSSSERERARRLSARVPALAVGRARRRGSAEHLDRRARDGRLRGSATG